MVFVLLELFIVAVEELADSGFRTRLGSLSSLNLRILVRLLSVVLVSVRISSAIVSVLESSPSSLITTNPTKISLLHHVSRCPTRDVMRAQTQ